jgi:hypothetical protein
MFHSLSILTDVKIRELDWYLRDYLFRQSNKGRQEFDQRLLPSEMIKLYLRYRNDKINEISKLLDIVIDNLLSRQVIKKIDIDIFELISRLNRLQCSKCFYVSYLSDSEERACLRCMCSVLNEFPKRKG